jgi:hypothetical protein
MDVIGVMLVSKQFRDMVSDAARAHMDHAQIKVRHLLTFVGETELLRAAVASAPRFSRPGLRSATKTTF